MFQKSSYYRKGFTLVETLVAISLLVILFSSMVAIFQVITQLIGEAKLRTIATGIASEKMEVIRNLSYADIGTVGGIPNGVIEQTEEVPLNGQNYLVQTTIIYIDDDFDSLAPTDAISTDYKRVKIAVSWGGAFQSSVPVTIISDFSPNGIETDEGGGTLNLNVINSSGIPISNADVSIVNDDVTPAINLSLTTGSDGIISLPGAPVCADCYKISVSKSGYGTERTYALSEIANPLKPDATVIEAEVTNVTFTIDQTANLTFYTTGSRTNNYPPFVGVQFNLKGSKILGTDDADQPVYKYQSNVVSGIGGAVQVNGIEPDAYEITIPEPSSVDLAGTYPLSPFTVLPGQNMTIRIVTQAASTNNLLVIMKDTDLTPIATASATLHDLTGPLATQSGGLSSYGDYGQTLFSNLSNGLYTIYASQSGYKEASTTAEVSGNSVVSLILEAL